MKVPPFLESAFQSDHKLAAFVSPTLARISSHVAANRMTFFPEYTDHSITHLELVLQTAFDLAAAPARGLLTQSDAAILTAAVALHDFGMYLTRDGFESLIAPGSHWKGVTYFDSKDWHTLWSDFFAEATRFDGRKLRLLFGENYRPVRPIPPKGTQWDDLDYLLVGEFLRQHHPRLAHEIALYGLPAKDGSTIPVCPNHSDDERFLADISGLIARSHGMNLRPCLAYLEEKYQNGINPRGVHAIFLAVLLRIADYFQIQATRAPTEHTDVTSFQSQLSAREWRVHQSVSDIHNTGNDPEAVVINANPKDIDSFLRLKEWLSGLQSELDRSWAILGEVYGLQRHNNLNLLGLKIRRIKSNVDNTTAFATSVSYVPERIRFEVANADLLKLLVGPLYNNDPGVGLRELFQNAIDAVREFEDSASRNPKLNSVERYEQEADVVLNVLCDENKVPLEIEVTDRGIGMTLDVVRDYFLKAGASFRRSNAWREEHEDHDGHSRVLRTGRFGVGALAAFLLGDEIEVTTRSAFDSGDGTTFTARLEDDAISLTRVNCPVGTRIKIKVPEPYRKRVRSIIPNSNKIISFEDKAGHYFLQRPVLIRHFSYGATPSPEHWLPNAEDDACLKWRWFKPPQFEKVFWTYEQSFPHLSCNGIPIVRGNRYDYGRLALLPSYLRSPNLAVFDKDGFLPVNLQRNGIQGSLPFEKELLESIAEDIAAHALAEGPKDSESAWFSAGHKAFADRREWPSWLISRDGFVLNEPLLLNEFSPKMLLVAIGGNFENKPWAETLRPYLPADALMTRRSAGMFANPGFNTKGAFHDAVRGHQHPGNIFPTGYAAFVPQKLIEEIKELRPGRAITRYLDRLDTLKEVNGWKVLSQISIERCLLDAITSLPIDERNPIILNIYRFNRWNSARFYGQRQPPSATPLFEKWMDILGTPVVPFESRLRSEIEDRSSVSFKKLLQIWKQRAAEEESKKKKNDEEAVEFEELE